MRTYSYLLYVIVVILHLYIHPTHQPPLPYPFTLSTELLRELRRQGVPHLRGRLPSELRSMSCVLGLPAPLGIEIASELSDSALHPDSHSSLSRGELYYHRCLTELNQLRSQVCCCLFVCCPQTFPALVNLFNILNFIFSSTHPHSPSHSPSLPPSFLPSFPQALSPTAADVSSRDITLMLGFSENLFLAASRQVSPLPPPQISIHIYIHIYLHPSCYSLLEQTTMQTPLHS